MVNIIDRSHVNPGPLTRLAPASLLLSAHYHGNNLKLSALRPPAAATSSTLQQSIVVITRLIFIHSRHSQKMFRKCFKLSSNALMCVYHPYLRRGFHPGLCKCCVTLLSGGNWATREICGPQLEGGKNTQFYDIMSVSVQIDQKSVNLQVAWAYFGKHTRGILITNRGGMVKNWLWFVKRIWEHFKMLTKTAASPLS